MKCNCTFSQKLVGDGCEVCNPKLAAEISNENQCDGCRQDSMVIKLLVAAGHVREETVEKARALALGLD